MKASRRNPEDKEHKVKRRYVKDFESDYKIIINERTEKINDCLIYKGSPNRNRARIFRNGKNLFASRYIYEGLNKITLNKDQVIMHTCDNGMCININHLKLGTQTENHKDMCNKKRHWAHKLTNCKRGHPFDTILKTGQRSCSICHRAAQREWRKKNEQQRESAKNSHSEL